MTYSYYVEPDYWANGYTEDITVNFVYSAARTTAFASIASTGTFIKRSGAAVVSLASVKSGANNVYLDGALVSASASLKAAGQNLLITTSLSSATSWARGAADTTSVFPGVNLNAKSSTVAAIGVTRKGSAATQTTASTKAGARIFWENTEPASGTWQTIVPQGDGFGPQ